MTHSDQTFTLSTLHAHVATASADCDGPMYREYVTGLTDEEQASHIRANGINDFYDQEFKARVLSNHVSSFSSEHGVVVHLDEHGFDVHEATDEGHRATDVKWCWEDGCDHEAYTQRDVFAEQMGY